MPVRVKKTRQNKKDRARSDSIGTEKALTCVGAPQPEVGSTAGSVV
jgi:hypothetical protein